MKELNFSKILKMLNEKENLEPESIKLINSLNYWEDKQKKIHHFIDKIRKYEMNRIFKEFLVNDYARRFNTTKRIVLSALLGEENVNYELSSQDREQKVINTMKSRNTRKKSNAVDVLTSSMNITQLNYCLSSKP